MRARDLLVMISAKERRGDGRKVRIRTADRRCKTFVARHQVLLRRCFQNPGAEVLITELIDATSLTDDLAALGFEAVMDANDRPLVCHPEGDEVGIRALVGLMSSTEVHERRRQMQREERALGRAS